MPTHYATFILNGASVSVKIVDGYFAGGTYTNPYPMALNFQAVDVEPKRGKNFFYTMAMKPFTTDEPLDGPIGIAVDSIYGKIALARS